MNYEEWIEDEIIKELVDYHDNKAQYRLLYSSCNSHFSCYRY